MDRELEILESVCLRFGLETTLVQKLMEVEEMQERRLRRRGIFQSLRGIIEETVAEASHDDSTRS